MTISTMPPMPTQRTFGTGGGEPYAAALAGSTDALYMVSADAPLQPSLPMPVMRWCSPADQADRSAVAASIGPVLDVGCGPGRMVTAALEAGLPALGIDVSPHVVASCREAGLPVLRRSVFEGVPRAGEWGTVLLIDGNVGIGGDVTALLQRCAELVRPGGRIVVETMPDPDLYRRFHGRVVAASGAVSDEFPWAEIGGEALQRLAVDHGLGLHAAWTVDGRDFCALQRLA